MQDQKIGSIYKIDLGDDCFAYCQIIAFNSQMGYLVRVFKYRGIFESDVEEIIDSGELFPPVFVGVAMALRSKNWVRIKKLKISEEEIPFFRASNAAQLDINDDSWRIWDGNSYSPPRRLSESEKALETCSVWGYLALNERIRETFDKTSVVL
jgi:hypothetical protein